jgi:large subunit ribosomal protein L9
LALQRRPGHFHAYDAKTVAEEGLLVMKVILIQDVPKLGSAGTIQDVANGYARNYLIPQGMATIATKGSIKQVEERQAAEAKRIAKQEEELRGLSERIQGTRIEIDARVGEQGRLYGSITSADIAERLSAAVGEEIDRRKIELDEPIRTVGEHEITVRLVGKLMPVITVAAEAAGTAETAEAGVVTNPEVLAADTTDGNAEGDEIE